jgi:cell wall assembly regulator SMI1
MDIVLMKENRSRPLLILKTKERPSSEQKANDSFDRSHELKKPTSNQKIGTIEIDIFENTSNELSYEFIIKDYQNALNLPTNTTKSNFKFWIENENIDLEPIKKKRKQWLKSKLSDSRFNRMQPKDNKELIREIDDNLKSKMISKIRSKNQFKNLNNEPDLSNLNLKKRLKKFDNRTDLNYFNEKNTNMLIRDKSKLK